MIVIQKEKEKFNFRVAALVFNIEDDKVLIHRKKGHNFWMLPGGRVEMGEDTEISIKRELEEELKINENVQIKYIIEDFFVLDTTTYHELCFYYKVNINPEKYNLDLNGEFNGFEGENYIFKWVKIDEITNYDLKPSFLKEKFQNMDSIERLEHVIIDER